MARGRSLFFGRGSEPLGTSVYPAVCRAVRSRVLPASVLRAAVDAHSTWPAGKSWARPPAHPYIPAGRSLYTRRPILTYRWRYARTARPAGWAAVRISEGVITARFER